MNTEITRAFEFAKAKHGNQMYGKRPYTTHLWAVLDKVIEMELPQEYKIVALLHDTLEDTDTIWQELVREFGEFVANTVFYMSKASHETYDEYIERLKNNSSSRAVKVCDLLCNLKESYLMEDCERRDRLIEKYEKALFVLATAKEE